jgi:P-type Cu+ transporter
MKALNLVAVALALGILGTITFTLCILWDLAFPPLSMVAIWKVLLPGFQGITWGSYLLGLVEVVLYALYTAVIFVPCYNWLARRFTEGPGMGGVKHV